MKTLVLGLGNELLGDDGIGILAARAIKSRIGDLAEICECNLAGMALLDILADYQYAIIIDAICTGKNKAGTILHMMPEDLKSFPCMSPHYAGLPDVISMAGRLGITFPNRIVILAVEIEMPIAIGKGLSESAAKSLDLLIGIVEKQLNQWSKEKSYAELAG